MLKSKNNKNKTSPKSKKTPATAKHRPSKESNSMREIPKKERIARIIFACIFFIFTMWLIAPVVSNITHEGMLFAGITGGGFLLSASPKLYDLVFKKSKVFARIFTVLIVIGCAVVLVILSLLIYGGTRPAQQNCTVNCAWLQCQRRHSKPHAATPYKHSL